MMNKSFWGWVLSAVLILAGCRRAESEIVLFRDEVQTITVSHWEAGEETTWELEQSNIAGVMEWAEGLDLEHKTFAEGNSPGDADGGNVYDFHVNGGDAAFSYVNSTGSYVLFDGEWYEVGNPANPPIEKPVWLRIPMVMVKGKLYYDTGRESARELDRDVADGEITESVDASEIPTENDQSNFGTGFPYQYGAGDTIEILLDEKWMVFEHRAGTGGQVRFGDRMVDADTLSEETIRWLDWYNSLPGEDQLKVSAVPPDLVEASGLAGTEDAEASAAAE